MPRHVFYERIGALVAREGDGTRTLDEERVRRPRRLLDACVHFLLPAWCAGCETPLPSRPSPLGLCAACRRCLPPPPTDRCRGCARPAASLLCASCERRGAPAFDALLAAWTYRPPIDEVIRRLKYSRLEFLADDLAAGMAEAIGEESAQRHHGVTAVPLHWRRRLGRGYDQAALLARAVADRVGLPFLPTLVRSRSTPPQVSRSAAGRRGNLEGAFRCRIRGIAALEGTALLLIDDVATTGATLEAASTTLKAAGVARITAVVAAWTPPGPR